MSEVYCEDVEGGRVLENRGMTGVHGDWDWGELISKVLVSVMWSCRGE